MDDKKNTYIFFEFYILKIVWSKDRENVRNIKYHSYQNEIPIVKVLIFLKIY